MQPHSARVAITGDTVDYAFEGARQPIKMLIREKKYMSLCAKGHD